MALEGKITVSTEQMRNQSNVVRNLVNTMEGKFSLLKDAINGTSAYWTGEAGEANRRQYMSFISKIEDMLGRYMEHVVDLEKMADIYEEAELIAGEINDSLPISTLD